MGSAWKGGEEDTLGAVSFSSVDAPLPPIPLQIFMGESAFDWRERERAGQNGEFSHPLMYFELVFCFLP